MPSPSRFVIENDWPEPVVINVEPEGHLYQLASGESVTVVDHPIAHPVTLKLYRSEAGELIISVWPGDGDARVEKNGVDLLDLPSPQEAGRPA